MEIRLDPLVVADAPEMTVVLDRWSPERVATRAGLVATGELDPDGEQRWVAVPDSRPD